MNGIRKNRLQVLPLYEEEVGIFLNPYRRARGGGHVGCRVDENDFCPEQFLCKKYCWHRHARTRGDDGGGAFHQHPVERLYGIDQERPPLCGLEIREKHVIFSLYKRFCCRRFEREPITVVTLGYATHGEE